MNAVGGSGEPRSGPGLLIVLGIAAAYLLAAWAGLMIAPPASLPGLLWPAAGVALAALVVFGVRRWPGVWLGGLVLVLAPGGMAAGDVWLALLLATGIAAQAVLGAALTRHLFVSPIPLSTPGTALRFLLLAGPVSCVAFASVAGAAAVTLDGALTGVPVADVWVRLWVGDSLGVALFAPLLLLVWPRMASVWGRVRWNLALPLIFVILALAVAGVFMQRAEDGEQQARWQAIADDAARSAQVSVARTVERLRSVERFFAASERVTRDEFTTFANLVAPSADVAVLHWAPRVPREELAAFEELARLATGFDDYRVFEPGDDGAALPPGARAEHFPVLYAVSEGRLRDVWGFDHGFEPERRAAMDEALHDPAGFDFATITTFLTGQLRLTFYLPHLDAAADPRAVGIEARREMLVGYVVGNIQPHILFDGKVAAAGDMGVALRSALVQPGEAPLILVDGFPPGTAAQWQIEIADPLLPLRIELSDLQPLAPNPFYPPIALLSGMFVAAMALLGAGRQAGTDAEVAARTAELREARVAADAANEAKSAFLATMSHEIRTPMNGVVGMLEVVEHGDLSVQQRDQIRTARASAAVLLTLIDDILDFSKIEAGRTELERAPLCVSDLVEGLCASQATVARRRGVVLWVYVDPSLPAGVLGDDTRLRQILYNLVGNAIKFSAGRPDRPGRVTVRAMLVSDDPLRLAFEVEDNGIGIEEAAQARLFDRFTQANASTTRRFGGTGLGLAISKRLVELMGGEIGVASRPGEGSRFTVTLPFERAAEQPARELPDLKGLHCFLVDDEELFAEALTSYLEHAGATAQRIADGAEALRATAANNAEPAVLVLTETAHQQWHAGDWPRHLRCVRIGFGHRRRARLLPPDGVTLDADALSRLTFLHAVAVAAGREPLEVFSNRTTDTLPGESKPPPTVALARADDRLILVAEDDGVNQEVILQQLALLGYAAEAVGDGAAALARWRDGGFALLLTDIHMPEIDGYDLAIEIRRHEAGGHRAPIIALTANALRGEAARAKAAGIDEFLTKPVPLAVLRDVLSRWLPPRTDAAAYASGATSQGPAASPPALDVADLQRLVGSDPAKVHRFLAMYALDAAQAVAELRAAASTKDHQQIAATAHKLKSSSRTVGAWPLGDLCEELESAARRCDERATEHAMARLDLLFAELEVELAPLVAAGGEA